MMQRAEDILKKIYSVTSLAELDSLKSYYLGKKGVFTEKFSLLKKITSTEKKKELGRELNELLTAVLDAFQIRKSSLLNQNINDELMYEIVDISLPVRESKKGKAHPISKIIKKSVNIFSNLGFEVVSGNEIEDEFHVFDALNTQHHHPARQIQDSFYLLNGLMLRPHTSSVQIHTMQSQKPPLRIMASGKVYRRDFDSTHTPMFHQLEGLCIDRSIDMSQLKFCVEFFIENLFGKTQVRFRPSFFPFTEPSAEVDILHNGTWLEILGCGMIHKDVFKNVGIDNNQYQGFAFGVGMERISMLHDNVDDLRLFFENNLSWLSLF